ncbi:MAG: hypothetical protein U1F43_12090 [Myxococcota bacterium]
MAAAAATAPACDTATPGDADAATQPTSETSPDASGSDPDATAPAGPVEVTGFNAVSIANGADTSPLTLGGVPPFSMGSTDLTFYNVSDAPLTITSVTLEVVAPTEPYEFALTQPGRTERLPVETTDLALAPNEGISFGIHFIPLASGPRDVKVRFKHTAGADYVVTVHARGRDNAAFSGHVTTALQRLLARSNETHSNGLELGGLAADPQGNLYFSGNGSEWGDSFNDNLVLGKVSASGALAWVYEWNEPYEQAQADIGNNGDTGGPADSIDVDAAGNVYATGYRVSCARTGGAPETAFVVSLGASGALRWARSLGNGGTSDNLAQVKQYLRGYAIDASLPDRVIVAGRVTASGGFLIAALSKTDGATLWANDISYGGGESRVGALVVDPATGAAYVGGIQGSVPFMAKVDGVDGAAPTLTWARDYQFNATSIHGAALDGNGLLVVLENRGLSTMFLAGRIAAVDGSVVWSRVWDATNSGDSNASLAVVKYGADAVFGGRIAIGGFDTQGGDGFLLGLDPQSGAYRWAAFHYGGKGAEEMAHDYIVAMVPTAAGLWALHQQTPGSNNHHHFWGRWYQAPDFTLELPPGDGAERLVDGDMQGLDVTSDTELYPLSDDIQSWDTMHSSCGEGAWVDWTSRFDTQDPVEAETALFQAGTHGLLQKLTISP